MFFQKKRSVVTAQRVLAHHALVIAVGKGKILENGTTQAPEVKAGDKVLIGKYSGSEVKLDGKDHIVLREDDILAILED